MKAQRGLLSDKINHVVVQMKSWQTFYSSFNFLMDVAARAAKAAKCPFTGECES